MPVKDLLCHICARIRALLLAIACPMTVQTNQNTGLLRLIACLSMLSDHAGKMLFSHYPVMRQFGRLAFPLFAYGIAVGAVYTKNQTKYLSRVVLSALICQPLYAVALAHTNRAMYALSFLEHPIGAFIQFYMNSWQKPSILFSLSLGLLLILCLRNRQWVLALGVYILCHRISGRLDYGINGIHLMLLMYLLCEHPAVCFCAIFSFMYGWAAQGSGYTLFGQRFGLQVFALPAAALCCLPMRRNLRMPRWFIYGFYPAHLIFILILCRI